MTVDPEKDIVPALSPEGSGFFPDEISLLCADHHVHVHVSFTLGLGTRNGVMRPNASMNTSPNMNTDSGL